MIFRIFGTKKFLKKWKLTLTEPPHDVIIIIFFFIFIYMLCMLCLLFYSIYFKFMILLLSNCSIELFLSYLDRFSCDDKYKVIYQIKYPTIWITLDAYHCQYREKVFLKQRAEWDGHPKQLSICQEFNVWLKWHSLTLNIFTVQTWIYICLSEPFYSSFYLLNHPLLCLASEYTTGAGADIIPPPNHPRASRLSPEKLNCTN